MKLLSIIRAKHCFFVQPSYTIITNKKGDGDMAGSTTNISIRMDSDLKAQADDETLAALLEAERIAKDPSVKGYTDLAELFADLKA